MAKDAKGHGSDAHGAGVDQVGKSFLPVVQSGGRDKNFYVQHGPSKSWLGSTLTFKKQKDGEAFVQQHLDPMNPNWRDAPSLMTPTYNKAADEFRRTRK